MRSAAIRHHSWMVNQRRTMIRRWFTTSRRSMLSGRSGRKIMIGLSLTTLAAASSFLTSTGGSIRAEELNLSVEEIEGLLGSMRRRRQVENVMAACASAGMIAADVALVSGTGLFGLLGASWFCVMYVYSHLERADPSNNQSRWRFNDVPSEMSNLIGMLEHARLQDSETFMNDESVLAQRLYAVGGMVCRESEIYDLGFGRRSWTFHCIDSEEMNAFVIPGGHVYVCRGLLETFKSSEELAVILAHEVSHIKAKHLDERISISSRFPFIIKCCFFIFNVFGGIGDAVISETMHNIKLFDLAWKGLLELPYSRLHETEADRMGMNLLLKLCIHPEVAVSVWEKMEDHGVGTAAAFELMSTHPSSSSRRRELQRMVPELEPEFDVRCASMKDDFQSAVNSLLSSDDGDLEYIV